MTHDSFHPQNGDWIQKKELEREILFSGDQPFFRFREARNYILKRSSRFYNFFSSLILSSYFPAPFCGSRGEVQEFSSFVFISHRLFSSSIFCRVNFSLFFSFTDVKKYGRKYFGQKDESVFAVF